MASVNKVILIGNLGRDPEMHSSKNGGKVATLNIATTEFRKDSKTEKSAEHTEWHRISIFGKLADVAEQYLKKGSSVFIEGRIKNNKWTDKAGIERYGVEVTCENLQMLGIHQQVKANDNIDTQESSISGIRTNNLLVSEIHPTNTFDEEDFPF